MKALIGYNEFHLTSTTFANIISSSFYNRISNKDEANVAENVVKSIMYFECLDYFRDIN